MAEPTPAKTLREMDIREFSVHICEQCLRLEGEMCHNPDCRFCRRTMKEVGEYLDALLIRPVVDGQRIVGDEGSALLADASTGQEPQERAWT